MDRKELIQTMREECTLKGKMPAVVFLKLNDGHIYNEGKADFVMSFRDDFIHFQFVSSILHRLKPRYDFQVNARRFIGYRHVTKVVTKELVLYEANGHYLPILYYFGAGDTYTTEDNIKRLIKILETDYNIKEMVKKDEKK